MKSEIEFKAWMRKVDMIIASVAGGLDSDDLPDLNYRDMFEDGIQPKSAAKRAIKNAGGE